jgi:hypothetical protein
MKKSGILCLLIALAFAACRKDIDEVSVTETPYVPEILKQWQPIVKPVNGSLTGFVTDEADEPVAGASVKLGNLSTTTDEYGHFFFKNVQLNARGTLVRVERAGFFPGSRRFMAVENAENRVKIQLNKRLFAYSFQADTGTAISLNGGAKIIFHPNSIQNADGSPYSGTVRVAAKWLDPTDLRTMDQMPGNLQGVSLEGQEVVMRTYGMLVAELQSDSGEKLNILKGKTATIKTPVPASILGSAPAEIPLWSYNETYGMWAEEGVSKLENGFYVAEVTHFSYWNHDFKDPLVEFTATFVDENGTPLENYKVVIRQPGTSLYGTGHTCDLGIISGLIPADYDLLLEVIGICNEVLYSTPIGPYPLPGPVDLGEIVVPPSVLNSTTITGTLVDCNGDPVANGLVTFDFDGYTVYEYVSGSAFEVMFSSCLNSTNVTVVGIDFDNLVQSDPVVSPANGTFDLGNIEACDVQLQNYIEVTIDGVTNIYTPVSVTDSLGTGFEIHFYNPSNQGSVFLEVYGQGVGDYSGTGHNILYWFDPVNNWIFEGQQFDNFEITAFGNTGEPIIGTFSGSLTNYGVQPTASVTVSGDFNIIREF